MNHDALFKQLLTTFFFEFLDALVPDAAKFVERGYVEFLDKETHGDPGHGSRRRESDIVAKVRFKGNADGYFVIHIEHESSSKKTTFPERIYRYFIRLSYRYQTMNVYPIALLSYDAPQKPAIATYEVAFPDRTVLKLHYKVIQLNRLSWRKFIKQPNPAATALMTKMNIAPKDRPKVKAQCMRLLATLKLDRDKSELIYVFVEQYLPLKPEEEQVYEQELESLGSEIKEDAMQIMSDFSRKIMQKGEQKGKEEMLALQLQQRFNALPLATEQKLGKLSSDQLNTLGLELFNFQSIADVENWLAAQ